MKIVFFGAGEHVLSVLEELNNQFSLELIVTTEKELYEPVVNFADKKKISYLSVSSQADLVELANDQLSIDNCQLGIVASFRLLLPKEILDLFPKGVLNIHPSLLPKYRGATPGQSAILNNDKKTGVSVIKLDEKMDHGSILWQKEEEIFESDTAQSLYLRLFKLGADAMPQTIKQYIKGDQELTPQNESKATYVNRLSRQSGYIDLDNPPTFKVLRRMIRAYFAWPGVWTELMTDNKSLRIKFLPEDKIQVEGKKPVSLKDFENGYPKIYSKILKLF